MLIHCTKLIPVLLTLLLFLGVPPSAVATESVVVVVKLQPGTDPVQLSDDYQVSLVGEVETLSLYQLQSNDPNLPNALAADPRVLSVQQEIVLEGQPRSADPDLNSELEAQRRTIGADRRTIGADGDPGEEYYDQWAVDKIRVSQAQSLLTGEGVTVAVLDTGIDLDHPLLADKLIPGYDFVDNDADPDDAIDGIDEDGDYLIDEGAGHGTHVAGIVTLAASEANIMPVRIFTSDGSGTYFDATAGIVYAVDNGADVINLSGSGPDEVDFFHDAVAYAWDHGVIVVTSGSINRLDYPAKYAHVISVGATDENDYRTDFSTFTDGAATAFAPGRSILSAFHSGEYAWWTGNSMATPFVAGEAALLLSSGSCDKYCVSDLIAAQGRPVPQETTLRVDLHDAVTTVLGQPDVDLNVQYMDGSGSPTNEQIKPFINIVNNGTTLPLEALKLRYWYTNDQDGVLEFYTDFAPFGAANVTGKFVSIVPLPGADRFLEVGFTPQAGVVYGGDDSGRAELRIMTDNIHSFNEADDYSFDVTKTGLADWGRITLYYGDTLVWGEEPGVVVPNGSLKVQYKTVDGNPDDGQIVPSARIINETNDGVPLNELAVRYWYTIDGEATQNYFCNYAVMGCDKVRGQFVKLAEAQDGADHYLELSFSDASGEILSGGETGEIQSRFNKTTSETYHEADDYSYNSNTVFADWDRVTLYRNGQLVWGQEPDGTVSEQVPPTATSVPPPTPLPTATVTPVPSTVTPVPPTATATDVVRDGWSRIEAESYDSSEGSLQVCGGVLCYVGANAWTQYDGVDLHTGTNKIELGMANGGGNTDIQVWVGGVNVGALTVGNTGGWNTYQTKSLTLPAQSGVKDVRLVFVNGNVNVDWFVFSVPPYQAEDGVVGGDSTVEIEHSGFYGSGYVNFSSDGGYVEYQNVDGGSGGSIILRFRFALGASGSRTGQLTVNGASQDITFDPTGGWDVWAIKEVEVNLNGGTGNTIRLESTGQDLANQDQLDIVSGTVPTETPT